MGGRLDPAAGPAAVVATVANGLACQLTHQTTDTIHTMRKQITTLLVVLTVLTMGATGALAAWDTETTNTTTTSDVDSTTTSVVLDPGNSSESTWFEVTASTSNLTLEISPAQSGVDYVAYSNSTPETTDETNGHYAFEVSHDEVGDLPRTIDGGDYNVTVINNDDDSTVAEASGVTFDTSGQSGTGAIMVVTADSNSSSGDASMIPTVADRLEVETTETWGGFGDDKNVSTWSGYTHVNGTSSDVTVRLEEADAADTYASAAEDYDDGEWIREATLFANGVPLQVYKNEAPDDLDSDVPYAVYNEDTDELEVYLAGTAFEDVRTLNLRGGAGEGYGFGTLQSEFGWGAALSSLWPF